MRILYPVMSAQGKLFSAENAENNLDNLRKKTIYYQRACAGTFAIAMCAC
jgi:uncharacterized membrane protein YjjP (DUF1212 family)